MTIFLFSAFLLLGVSVMLSVAADEPADYDDGLPLKELRQGEGL